MERVITNPWLLEMEKEMVECNWRRATQRRRNALCVDESTGNQLQKSMGIPQATGNLGSAGGRAKEENMSRTWMGRANMR